MAAAPVIPHLSVDEYLHTTYHPDADYIDGTLEQRNVGEYDHSDLQGELVHLFRTNRAAWQVTALPEQRVQVSPSRFRVPDVCVLRLGIGRSPIVTQPPLLCIEILSPEDRIGRIRERCDDYFRMGVPEVWIFDPSRRDVLTLRADGTAGTTTRTGTLTLPNTPITFPLEPVFAVLDE